MDEPLKLRVDFTGWARCIEDVRENYWQGEQLDLKLKDGDSA